MDGEVMDPDARDLGDREKGMREPDEVAAMVRLKSLGWGVRRIASALGCSHMTVRRYLAAGGWVGYRSPGRSSVLEGLEGWLVERFRRHRGNADVVRQDLEREHGLRVSLRTIQRAVAPLRRELAAEARATVRFETPPGHQLQVDFGELGFRWRARPAGCSCSSRPLATRVGFMCGPFAMSGNRPGSTASRAPSETSAG